MPLRHLSAERKQFLGDCLAGAIENGGHGAFVIHDWMHLGDDPANWCAYIEFLDDEFGPFRVNIETMIKGFNVIHDAVMDPFVGYLMNNQTGDRLWMLPSIRNRILLHNRTNGAEGNMDVSDYLAVLDCALFGTVVHG